MDIIDKHIEKYGIVPKTESLELIRKLLKEETAKEAYSQGEGNTELMKVCCIQLFSQKNDEDIFLIWQAKQASFDAACSIDIQLMCPNGFHHTIDFLSQKGDGLSLKIQEKLKEYDEYGDFEEDFDELMKSYIQYYGK